MNENEQIEEMAKVIYEASPLPEMWCSDAEVIATELHSKGYRKVERGEWDEDGVCKQCSQCGDDVARYDEYGIYQKFDFCPHCGADMRGSDMK